MKRDTKTILVADDQVAIRRAVELKLSMAGYRILSAGDGEAALALIVAHKPDAVIADITMPRMDGRELCERTDALKQERPFLTVMVTARIAADERQWISRMTNTIFMEKPFSLLRLIEVLDQNLGVTA